MNVYGVVPGDVYVATASVGDPLCGSLLKNKRHHMINLNISDSHHKTLQEVGYVRLVNNWKCIQVSR